jgi:hypothetical protein
VDESQYRQTYRDVNQRRCVFEKAINARRCTCSQAQRFNLADREGVACVSGHGNLRCQRLLELLRNNASFALQLKEVPGPLPHAKEMKVQIGGMLGLQQLLDPARAGADQVHDINALAHQAERQFKDLAALPFTEIVKSIVHFQVRPRRQPGPR